MQTRQSFTALITKLILSLSLFLIITPSLYAKDSNSSDGTENSIDEIKDSKLFFDEAFDDYQQELEIAKENGKQGVLIMYEMENCPFCARMKATVLNHSKVQDYFHKNFRIFTVDIDGDLEITDFAGKTTTQKDFSLKNRVRATPVFQFYNLDGKPIKNGRLTGATKNTDEFLMLGEFIAEKHNEKLSFSRYKRSKKQEQKQAQKQ